MNTPRIETTFVDEASRALASVGAAGRPRALAAACRLVTAALRDGRPLDQVIDQAMEVLERGGWGHGRDPDGYLAREMFYRLCVEAFRASAAERDLARAAAVQHGWSPAGNGLRSGSFEVAGHLDTAGPCGGDLWDARPLPGGGLLLAIGDVTGSGMDAALVVAAARGALGVACRMLRTRPFLPADVLRVMNGAVLEVGGGHLTMTCTVVVLYEDGALHAAGAGHPLPYLIRADGSLSVVSARGPSLGIPGATYDNVRDCLDPRDSVFLFTDGVTEARASGEREFGHRRLRQFLRTTPRSPVAVARDSLFVSLVNHRRGHDERDDLAFVLARRSPRATTLAGLGPRRRLGPQD